MSYQELRSSRDLAALLQRSPVNLTTDLDELYQRQIKVLSAIKAVTRSFVQAGKDIKHLQKNLTRYGTSPNSDIGRQYAALRASIAEVLQVVGQVDLDRQSYLQSLDDLAARIAAEDIIENGTLDALIREGRITSAMGTSLINDNGYTQNIANKLIHAGQTIFGSGIYDLVVEARETTLEGAEDQEQSGSAARATAAD